VRGHVPSAPDAPEKNGHPASQPGQPEA
jgi:hypothetical protein